MGSLRISLVRDPPTDEQFLGLFKAILKPRKSAPITSKHLDVLERLKGDSLNTLVVREIGFLRTHLSHYWMSAPGHEALYASRKAALDRCIATCDKVCELLHTRLRAVKTRQEGAELIKESYGRLIKGINDTRAACDAKRQQLEQLEHFMSEPNLVTMLVGIEGKLSAKGKELRGMTADHLPEAFNPFHQYSMNHANGVAVFEEWVKLMRNARATGGPDPAPFPIFVEGHERIDFLGHGAMDRTEFIHYDGSGKDSEYFVDVEDGFLVRMRAGNGQFWNERLTTKVEGLEQGDDLSTGYVIDENENLFVFSHKLGQLHHSSPTGGAAVICAGMVEVIGGKITQITDKSGHYAPTPRHMLTGLRILAKRGVLAEGAQVFLKNTPGQPR